MKLTYVLQLSKRVPGRQLVEVRAAEAEHRRGPEDAMAGPRRRNRAVDQPRLCDEARLYDRIFYGLSSAADLSFMEVCRGWTIQIRNFTDVVAIRNRSPERLFTILDVFETLQDLMPEFESVFFFDQIACFSRTKRLRFGKG
ncbi:hypothetical protein ACFX13_009611 [Malus domestica]